MDLSVPKASPLGSPEPASSDELLAGSFVSAGAVAESIFPALSTRRPGICTNELTAAWVHFLAAYEWQWFTTCTFREAVHPERADKAFRYWVGCIDESRLGRNYRSESRKQRRCVWVRALEWQKREVIHYHALIGNMSAYDSSSVMREVWAKRWNEIGGFARIDAYKTPGVVAYVAKYVSKGGQVDLSPLLRLRGVPRVSEPESMQATVELAAS